jgi:hypothetical protein
MRRLSIVLLVLGAAVYGMLLWYRQRLEVDELGAAVMVKLPSSFDSLLAQIELLRPLHEQKRPNQAGDWLDRYPEGGQLFGHYVQYRGGVPLKDEYRTIYLQPLGGVR